MDAVAVAAHPADGRTRALHHRPRRRPPFSRGGCGYHPDFPAAYPTWHDAAALDWLVQWWTDRLETTPLPWLISRDLAEAAGPWAESGVSRLDDFEYLTRVLLATRPDANVTPGSRAFFVRWFPVR